MGEKKKKEWNVDFQASLAFNLGVLFCFDIKTCAFLFTIGVGPFWLMVEYDD